MRRTFVYPGIGLLFLLCILAGIWVYRQRGPLGTAAGEHAHAEILSSISPQRADLTIDRAISEWLGKAQQNPRDSQAWTGLGEALMHKGQEYIDVGSYTRAESAFRKALRLDPENTQATNGMAWVAISRRQVEQAIEWANKVVARDPKNQTGYRLLGDAAMEKGDYEAAFEHYQRMQDLRADLFSYSRGAYLLFLSGDVRKSIWLMQRAIDTGAPRLEDTARCRAQLVLMLWNTGALLPAEQKLKAALNETPHNYHLLAAMGKVKASRKDYKAAIDYYKRAIGIAPGHEAVVALGDLYTLTHNKEEAEKQFALVDRIHQLNRENGVQDHLEMARFYADHVRNLPEALEMAKEEYHARPSVFAADTLAWCYYKNGRYQDAGKIIRKALSRRTPDASFLFHAGMIYAKGTDRVAAKTYLYQALSLNPYFHPVDTRIAAETLKQLGSPEKR